MRPFLTRHEYSFFTIDPSKEKEAYTSMRTKALNEDFLWKGTIQRANYRTMQQPPMDLPKINSLTGKPYPTNDRIHDELCHKTHEMSCQYWEGEKKRRQAYREKHTIHVDPMTNEERIFNKIWKLTRSGAVPCTH